MNTIKSNICDICNKECKNYQGMKIHRFHCAKKQIVQIQQVEQIQEQIIEQPVVQVQEQINEPVVLVSDAEFYLYLAYNYVQMKLRCFYIDLYCEVNEQYNVSNNMYVEIAHILNNNTLLNHCNDRLAQMESFQISQIFWGVPLLLGRGYSEAMVSEVKIRSDVFINVYRQSKQLEIPSNCAVTEYVQNQYETIELTSEKIFRSDKGVPKVKQECVICYEDCQGRLFFKCPNKHKVCNKCAEPLALEYLFSNKKNTCPCCRQPSDFSVRKDQAILYSMFYHYSRNYDSGRGQRFESERTHIQYMGLYDKLMYTLHDSNIYNGDKLNDYRSNVYAKAYKRMTKASLDRLLYSDATNFQQFKQHVHDKCLDVEYNMDKLLTPKQYKQYMTYRR